MEEIRKVLSTLSISIQIGDQTIVQVGNTECPNGRLIAFRSALADAYTMVSIQQIPNVEHVLDCIHDEVLDGCAAILSTTEIQGDRIFEFAGNISGKLLCV